MVSRDLYRDFFTCGVCREYLRRGGTSTLSVRALSIELLVEGAQ